ncbi:hypothetical protein B0A55_13313, partial [Friedmanniomyces simplex]
MLALDAISLASAIVQFVDFSAKLVIEAKDFVNAAGDALPQNADLAAQAKRSDELAEVISGLMLQAQPLNKTEEAMRHLVQKCHDEANGLATLLETLKPKLKPDGTKSLSRAIFSGIRSKYKRSEIDARRERLEGLQKQLGDQLLYSIRDSQMKEFAEVKELIANKGADGVATILTLKDQMLDCFASIQHAVEAQEAQLSRIEGMLLTDRDRSLASEIVDGLAYAVMTSRREKIEDHHQETFGWIFSETETPFKRWLADSGGIFWVSSEAGSGKSTLMKFLRTQSATERALQGWGLGKTLLILKHFFWVAGSPLQKTME